MSQIAKRLEWLLADQNVSAREMSRWLQEHAKKIAIREGLPEGAHRKGLSNNTVGGLIFTLRRNGDYHGTSSRALRILAEVTHVSLDWLLLGIGDPYNDGRPAASNDPAYPNRGVACEFARRSGMLESAIKSVMATSPPQDLNPMDWYQMIGRAHDAAIKSGHVQATWHWQADRDHLVTRSAQHGLFQHVGVGKRWWVAAEDMTGGLKVKMESGHRFENYCLEMTREDGTRVRFTISGWPRYDDRGRLLGYSGEGMAGCENGAESATG